MIFRHASLFLALALLAVATAQMDFEVIDVDLLDANDGGAGSGQYLTTLEGGEDEDEGKDNKEKEEKVFPLCDFCLDYIEAVKNDSNSTTAKQCKKEGKKEWKEEWKKIKKELDAEDKTVWKDAKTVWKDACKSTEWKKQCFKNNECGNRQDMCHDAKLCPKSDGNNRNDPDDCSVSGEVCHCCLDIVRASKDYADESEEDADALDFCKEIVQGNLSVGEDGDEDEEDQCVYDSFQNSDCRDWFGDDAESNKPKDLCVETGYCTCSMSNSKSRRRKLGRAEPVYN